MHDSHFICVILISGNFPETAWWAIHSRQAAHTKLCVSLGSLMNRLAVKPCTAKRRNLVTFFWAL